MPHAGAVREGVCAGGVCDAVGDAGPRRRHPICKASSPLCKSSIMILYVRPYFQACALERFLKVDRFQRNKSDPSVIVFSEIKRCQRPHFTQLFQKAKKLKNPSKAAEMLDSVEEASRRQCLVPSHQCERGVCVYIRRKGSDAHISPGFPAPTFLPQVWSNEMHLRISSFAFRVIREKNRRDPGRLQHKL